jgi:septum site-determining protein MinC
MPLKNLPFELRSGSVDTLLFVVKTSDLDEMRAELRRRFDATPEFFANDAVAIDLRRLAADQRVSVGEVADMLRQFRMHPAGIVADAAQRGWADNGVLPLVESRDRRGAKPEATEGQGGDAAAPAAMRTHEAQGAQAAQAAQVAQVAQVAQAPQDVVGDAGGSVSPAGTQRGDMAVPTLVIDKPLRSGQQVYTKGDLVVLAVVSHGAEVIAHGNIHIYAPLRGRALAGVHGNHAARIFCTCLEPELISIAGIYRTTDTPLSPDLVGRAVQIRLDDDEKLLIEPLRLT